MNSLVPVFYFPKRTQSPEILGDLSEFIQLIKKRSLSQAGAVWPIATEMCDLRRTLEDHIQGPLVEHASWAGHCMS